LWHGLQKLAVQRRKIVSELLAYLGEVDARRLYARFATSSMFAFCVDKLRLSEPSAYRYLAAARLAKRYPLALRWLEQGRVHLSGLALLSKHLDDENGHELLALADGKSKRGLQRALAERFPQADVPSRIRKLPEPRVAGLRAPDPCPANAPSPTPTPPQPRVQPVRIEPLRARRYRIQFSASQSFVDKLEKAKALLGRQVPSGELEAVLELALDQLVKMKMKQKFAQTDKPRKTMLSSPASKPVSTKPVSTKPVSAEPVCTKPANSPRSRHIPAVVKRAVLERDGMRCSYVDEAGQRCPEISGLEFHHQEPFARGGKTTVDNLTLRCRPHNYFQAQLDFGGLRLRRRIAERRARAHNERRARTATRITLTGERTTASS